LGDFLTNASGHPVGRVSPAHKIEPQPTEYSEETVLFIIHHLSQIQGDLMRLGKSRPKGGPIRSLHVNINAQLLLWKKVAKLFGYLCTFPKTTQLKQSRHGRKFDQSGHPCQILSGFASFW
jgi:hypothetical protein